MRAAAHLPPLPHTVNPDPNLSQVSVRDSLFVGQSRPEVCSICTQPGEPGCAPKLSKKSYNQVRNLVCHSTESSTSSSGCSFLPLFGIF